MQVESQLGHAADYMADRDSARTVATGNVEGIATAKTTDSRNLEDTLGQVLLKLSALSTATNPPPAINIYNSQSCSKCQGCSSSTVSKWTQTDPP